MMTNDETRMPNPLRVAATQGEAESMTKLQ